MQGVLSLHSVGKTTGVVLDSGDGITHTIPVYEGYAIPHAIEKIPIAGRDITEYMRQLLNNSGYSFNTAGDMEIVRDIKKKTSYVCQDISREEEEAESSQNHYRNYELPDGRKIVISNERFRASEIIF